MGESRLGPLQRRVLDLLSALDPAPVLTGGAALAGFYTFHRTTKDLDLFWRGLAVLGDLPDRALRTLREAGLRVETIQRSPSFHRLRVEDGGVATIVDLVADPVPTIEPPALVGSPDRAVLADTRHEILVNKLTTLLSRSEARDLEDVRVLLETGGDLSRALADAPKKDGGFSPLTLAWVLQGFRAGDMASSLGWEAEDAARLERFKGRLLDLLLVAGAPPGPA